MIGLGSTSRGAVQERASLVRLEFYDMVQLLATLQGSILAVAIFTLVPFVSVLEM